MSDLARRTPRNDPGARLDRIHSVGGCLVRGAYGGFAALYLLACLLGTPKTGTSMWLIAVAAVVNVAAVTIRLPLAWAVAAALASALSTLLIAPVIGPDLGNPSMFAEIGGLLIVIARVVWRAPRRLLVWITVTLAVAVLIVPLRWSVVGAVLFTAPLGICVAIALGAGLYLRAVDARRSRSLAAARRDERLELARDLHDFVAHHVTGIVVQAQAARFATRSGAGQSPEQLDTMFEGIEQAGTEALTSMRRMVGLLRDAQHGGAADGEAFGGAAPGSGGGSGGLSDDRGSATRPVGDLAQLERLVEGFTHPRAVLARAPDLGSLPPEVATSVHRVVQEALTNVRKHAADATSVQVSVARLGDGSVEVCVRDDGQGRGRRLPSSGFGLSGLGERVDALGGRLSAGPRPEGGWEVVAVLPVHGARRA
ncbi:sensor histidine kinase [Actinomadura sp. NEAU-AAG7]|uniref:sensor histidine kinase n=1 Tax=Actinomadura sp. NEAU-AAG7 TaxID=2839640 RepID=UPI001BE4D8F4|nr:histidine kinase [Actinomadura sp. NEAU-AAG7]MBT2208669.1 two-component sensor histidine kinase [Actinomadura sp. NEAU-AAG7]